MSLMDYWPIVLFFGIVFLIVCFAFYFAIMQEIQTTKYCEEKGYEGKFYKDGWHHCISENKIVKVQCTNTGCYGFDKQEVEPHA